MSHARWLSAAVLGAGVLFASLFATPMSRLLADDPKKPAERDEAPADPFREILKQLEGQPGFDPEDLRQMQRMMDLFDRQAGRMGRPALRIAPEDMRRQFEEMRRQMDALLRVPAAIPDLGAPGRLERPAPGDTRLGVLLAKPAEVLVEQLDLPRGQGLVIDEVMPGTPAAAAGLKAHDVLLELAGKPVPSDLKQFAEVVRGLKTGEAVEAIVLRKGRRETVKDLKPAEPKAEAPMAGEDQPARRAPGVLPGGLIRFPDVNIGAAAGDVVVRAGGRFTVYSQAGGVKLTVVGKVVDGKKQLEQARIEDGDDTFTADSLDQVPEKYRPAVEKVLNSRR